MTDMDRMVAWLRETLDAAQADAEAATPSPWHVSEHEYDEDFAAQIGSSPEDADIAGHGYEGGGVDTMATARHMVRHQPAAVLRRIAADRKTLALHTTPHTVVELAVEPVGELFCSECGGPCTHKGEAECVICGQDGCDTVRNLAEAWGWTEETT